ncbi:hypothetical protein L3i22_061100 [Actinoplanes sp. L3-i22]|nr:hypothetical protein L3i22_061100 [Actinoplanes sp. L3-i22]
MFGGQVCLDQGQGCRTPLTRNKEMNLLAGLRCPGKANVLLAALIDADAESVESTSTAHGSAASDTPVGLKWRLRHAAPDGQCAWLNASTTLAGIRPRLDNS